MSRFRKTHREVPSLNTTSLPDLIFTLLLFFMLVVNMRSVPALTQFQLPNTKELQKLKEKSLLIYIIAGKTEDTPVEEQAPIQLNNDFTTLEAMPEELKSIKSQIAPDERSKIVVILKIDRNTPMGLVNDIRQILREQNLLTVYYAAEKPHP
ncbi:MAG: biopolymer transporter ExbD [Candidatus Symbiothrix sp.]|jgi:biopolymer transport protein ExbD|nr:biopolymer transporter ExbD [Candidatus Symbiothrix sp.]